MTHRTLLEGPPLETAAPDILAAAQARVPGGFKLTGLIDHDGRRITAFCTALEGENRVEVGFEMPLVPAMMLVHGESDRRTPQTFREVLAEQRRRKRMPRQYQRQLQRDIQRLMGDA